MPETITPRHLRAQLAATTRHHPDADTTELRTELLIANTRSYFEKQAAKAPPINDETRARLAAIFSEVA